MSVDRCHSPVRVRHRQLQQLLEIDAPPHTCSVFVGHQKYGDKVKAEAMLPDVMRGVVTTYRESTTNPIHVLPTDNPSSARSLVYTLLPTNELYILSFFLALPTLMGAQTLRLEPVLRLCDYAALNLLHVLLLMKHLLLVARGAHCTLDGQSRVLGFSTLSAFTFISMSSSWFHFCYP